MTALAIFKVNLCFISDLGRVFGEVLWYFPWNITGYWGNENGPRIPTDKLVGRFYLSPEHHVCNTPRSANTSDYIRNAFSEVFLRNIVSGFVWTKVNFEGSREALL